MSKKIILSLPDYKIDLSNKSIIMGILNLSLDSPVKSSIVPEDLAIDRAKKLKKEGATIIDVGAHSTSSKSTSISTETEIKTVIPIVKSLINEGFLVSLDSWNPKVVNEACKSGLIFLNDVSGLQNPKMVEIVKKFDLSVCIMHMRGNPKHHYEVDQSYSDISSDIVNWFDSRISSLGKSGIKNEKLILDPGFEFGKKMNDNLKLINNFHLFSKFKNPILVSASNKPFISEAIGLGRKQEGEGLLEATIGANAILSYLGAHILRVHDVKRINPMLKLINELKKSEKIQKIEN